MGGKQASVRRPDIQGLRGVAVIAVVLFHLGEVLPAGYVGVDIFFVISGFVITTSILNRYSSVGKEQIVDFFRRRAQRLLPALFAMLTFTVVAAGWILSPIGPAQVAALTGFGATLSLGNLAIAASTGGYFDPAAELNPLLHTWSLAVEEQFYLAFPLILVLAFARKRSSITTSLGLLVASISTASFALMFLQNQLPIPPGVEDLVLGFYSPLTRAWEFGAGTALALHLRTTRIRIGHSQRNVLYLSGLLLLAASFSPLSLNGQHPGLITLLPVLATSTLIVAGSEKHAFSELDPLSSKTLTHIGDWSYSIYLWHWPLIVFASIIWPENKFMPWVSLIFCVAIALCSFHFLENPSRGPIFTSQVGGFMSIGVMALVPLSISALVFTSSQSSNAALGSPLELPVGYELGCHGPGFSDDQLKVCIFTPPSLGESKNTAYLVGDSHAAHLSAGLIEAAETRRVDLEIITASGCPFLGLPAQVLAKDCSLWNNKTAKYLLSSQPGFVIIGASHQYFLGEPPVSLGGPSSIGGSEDARLSAFQVGLFSTASQLQAYGHTVIYVTDVPTWDSENPWDPSHCTRWEIESKSCFETMTLETHLSKTASIREIIALGESRQLYTSINFLAEICPEQICTTHSESAFIYRDSGHLTNSFSRGLGPIWSQLLRNGSTSIEEPR